ncbi:aldehyde dehydrogenase family protein [Saliterribacillus persicus]|uniref:Acyl-CoA reductase-like NAD-dependent aldehyde dehydrogenase n=1 Tax=Saliterribacillus persicus TaxID=930114 RepID=A0A368YAD1_9BACI|nr:aldehyde dehydrogenase family protein [Saliterribacillus persicus]RCW77162.1 acyl-CoA reductase-like NAD-dependent aldehyde dehydrogenase [Saliterribacillus persicus]
MEKYHSYINGNWIENDDKLEVLNKYTQEVYATVSKANESLVDEAITEAGKAFKEKALTPYERYEVLKRASEIMLENKEELALLITTEAGKPLKQSRTEIERSSKTFEIAAEEAKRINGEGVPVEATPGSENRMAFTIKVPVGVVGAISPFNFPLNLVSHKVAPALAAGNAVVLKPASKTPLSSLKLAMILEEAGLPKGLFHVVVGAGSTVGQTMMEDKRIALYTFTGSAAIGQKLKEETGIKKLILELGNNSPVIVDKEADIQQAAETLASQSFAFSGQVCISVQRLYVHEDIAKAFKEKFIKAIENLNVGNPHDADTDVGPMIAEEEAKRAEEWINEALSNGASLLHGGARKGALLQPTVLENVKKDMKVVCEEIFAPVVSLISYSDLEDCIDEINESDYGLQGGIFTQNIDTAFYAAKNVRVGGFMINDGSQYRVDLMPYGGVKDSGNGKEGPKYSINEMTEERLIVMNLK